MLQALETLADRLESLPLATRQELVFQVDFFREYLLSLNRDYLAKLGQRPDGERIGAGTYTTAYAKYRAKYGLQTRFIDLKFTGDFLDSFQLHHEGSGVFRIVATDEKAGFLKKYGELLGVREEDIEAFITQLVEPEIRAFVGRYVGNL
jgi:hypothetical protein